MRNPLLALLHEAREDRFTVAFAGLLENRDVLAAFLTRALGWPPASDLQPYRIATQAPVPDGSADILLEGTTRVAVVEAKLGAAFGEGQPENYARYLAQRMTSGHGACLVILAPAASLGSYVEVAAQRLAMAGLATVPLRSISWEEVGELCSSLAPKHGDADRAFLQAFADVIASYLGEAPRPLSQSEALGLSAPEFIRGFKEAYALIDPVSAWVRQRLPEAQVKSRTNGVLWLGSSVTYRARECWIGLWVEPWLAFGRSLLWAQMVGRVPPFPDELRRRMRLVEYSESLLCPLILAPELDRRLQVERLGTVAVEFLNSEGSAA